MPSLYDLDKELEKRGLRFARYADDFLVLVKSLRAAQRVMQGISRFVESRLKLVVNRQKSKAAPLGQCAFLGFEIRRGRIVWTEKAQKRFKERIQEITSRSRGVSTFCMLRELKRYVVGWMLARRESEHLAERLIRETVVKQGIVRDQLTIHSDRGPSMRSQTVAQLLATLGITKSNSRPHVSDDNPFSEAQFKTLKYRPDFPDRFQSMGGRFNNYMLCQNQHRVMCDLSFMRELLELAVRFNFSMSAIHGQLARLGLDAHARDFADVKRIMTKSGEALIGIGKASGEDRHLEAAQRAMHSPHCCRSASV